jgi:predicted ABC-type ATPase
LSKLFIIAGPNGAGKTTASLSYLKDELDCLEFVNSDFIASGISPFQPEKVSITAGKIMIERINELLKNNIDFAVETTLSSKYILELIKIAKTKKYETFLVFYWLESSELAIERVESRVIKGGHSIPYETIIRRYDRGNINFFYICNNELVDYWMLINNSNIKPSIIAEGTKKDKIIFNYHLWEFIGEKYGYLSL